MVAIQPDLDIASPFQSPLPVIVVSTPRHRAAALTLLLSAVVLLSLTPFLSGLLGAAAAYVVLVRPYRWLAARVKPFVAASLTVLAALLLVAIPLAWLVVNLLNQAPDALRALAQSRFVADLGQLQVGDVAVGKQLADAAGALISWTSGHAFGAVGDAAATALNVLVTSFGLYYMLREGDGKWAAIREYIPFSTATADAFRDRFVGVTEATLLGTGLIVVVQGVLIGFAFAIVQLPHPLFWGAIAAVTAIVPVIGSTLVWAPATAVLLSQHRYGAAITMVVIASVIAGNAEHLIRPLVYRRISDIHPMITLIGAIAGLRYFGLVGLLFGPLAIAYVFELLRVYREEYGASA